jgi:hypothetical protein
LAQAFAWVGARLGSHRADVESPLRVQLALREQAAREDPDFTRVYGRLPSPT